MDSANQVVPFHKTIRHQCATMRATPIHNGYFIVEANNDKIDICDERMSRCAILEIIPIAYRYFLHSYLNLLIASAVTSNEPTSKPNTLLCLR